MEKTMEVVIFLEFFLLVQRHIAGSKQKEWGEGGRQGKKVCFP